MLIKGTLYGCYFLFLKEVLMTQKVLFDIRIGIKLFSIGIRFTKGNYKWFKGKYLFMISKQRWIESESEWGMHWWTFIPVGRRR
jgi:hypothetical protein